MQTVRREDLIGRWRLVAWSTRADDGTLSHPFGENPEGSLVYTAEGWMSAMLAPAVRPSLSTADPLGGDESERAAAFSTFIAYAGTYDVDGDDVVHQVTVSMFPNWVGTAQRRTATLIGDVLILRTAPLEVLGRVSVNELRWVREERFRADDPQREG